MKRRALLALFCGAAGAAEPPRRIISTAPSITEMLYALGLGNQVVGVTTYCNYPPEARDKPRIGTYLRPDLEAVLHQKPDLIVLLEQAAEARQRLAAFRIPILSLRADTLRDIYGSLDAIGRRTGAGEVAGRLVAALRAEMAGVAARVSGRPRRRVMFVVGRTPASTRDVVVVGGGGTFLSELVDHAGGENVFRDSRVAYPKVSREDILARRPEVIIDAGDAAGVELWKQVLPARAYVVDPDTFSIPGPRVGQVARQLARLIHPEAGL